MAYISGIFDDFFQGGSVLLTFTLSGYRVLHLLCVTTSLCTVCDVYVCVCMCVCVCVCLVTAFSSLEAPLQPMVEKQTFIFPSQIEAMRETTTEKGITTKFIMCKSLGR